jgi:hypothetical protein
MGDLTVGPVVAEPLRLVALGERLALSSGVSSLLCQIAFHLAGVSEIFVAMKLIGAEVPFTTALLMESVNRAINMAFVFVPALVGVDELSTRELADLMGFDGSLGVTLAIIRKIRTFFWIGIGLFFLEATKRKS